MYVSVSLNTSLIVWGCSWVVLAVETVFLVIQTGHHAGFAGVTPSQLFPNKLFSILCAYPHPQASALTSTCPEPSSTILSWAASSGWVCSLLTSSFACIRLSVYGV